jgi:hypothetical protein
METSAIVMSDIILEAMAILSVNMLLTAVIVCFIVNWDDRKKRK